MCGYVGFFNKKENKQEIIKKMTDKIIHRGPDEEGYYIDDFIALGHRRLSIIDLKKGSQPMFNEDDSLIIVYNGEIYNFQELRDELKIKKHIFKTNCDTEVILHGYEEWGTSLPEKLRGMFSFAIYDKNNQEIFLARDPFGIKPLYYTFMNETFMFASEIKAFLDHEDFQKVLNEEILKVYLEFSFVPTIETFFKGVYRLDAGSSLLFKENQINIQKYYKLNFDESMSDYEKAVKEIEEIMTESINKHMISDVEVGSFLSSGIDSSYIVSLAKTNQTYTVGYNIDKYNEVNLAKNLTDLLNLNNKSKIITKEEYMGIISTVMYHLDEPLSDPAAVSLYFVAKMASEDLKVILSGEGADEFFGGYNYYREEVDFKFYNKIPFFIRNIISRIARLFPEKRGLNFLVRRGEKLENSYIGVNRNFSKKMANQVLNKKYKLESKEVTKPIYQEFKKESNIVKMQAIDIHFWLMKDILLKADRMTMAASIEGRTPFIDKEVFAIASKLPINFKVTKANTKIALRDAAKKVIPNESYKKKKLGFPVPIREWMREDDVYEMIKETFSTEVSKKYFNNKKIIKLLDDHKNAKEDNYRKVWTIYCFLKWYEVFFKT